MLNTAGGFHLKQLWAGKKKLFRTDEFVFQIVRGHREKFIKSQGGGRGGGAGARKRQVR
jgi:hypothetical protein